MFSNCKSLVDLRIDGGQNLQDARSMFAFCNNLSDDSIQNIINMFLNNNVMLSNRRNLATLNTFSPFCYTNITSDRYSNRLDELTAAGWAY